MCSLESLKLSGNEFSDQLEDSLDNKACAEDTLKHLQLGSKRIWGPFPDITRFSSLIELNIWDTNLSGTFPKNFGQLS
ncbi:LRR domain containing protein [Parasponia andersonii]|uniref:LRR domain containing protein n=1 Tax=Parasponia andersonii TaxID=3476 RepID=A0A2P5CB10_PARAD|nr:LRR domain containing protein [Parasponia andersonii]